MRIPAVIVTVMVCLGSMANAQNYTANYVPMGSFDSGYGIVEVSYDLNQPHDVSNGAISAAIKGTVPNPNFYSHFVSNSDHETPANGDQNPVYFSELIAIDCDHQISRAGHAVYYNSQNQWVADHDYQFQASPIVPNSLASVVAQKICGK